MIALTMLFTFAFLMLWLIISELVYESASEYWNRDRTRTNFNAIALINNLREKDWKPKSKIEKNIAKELKKIKKEEDEIESMEELKRLIKRRELLEKKKDKLFEEME